MSTAAATTTTEARSVDELPPVLRVDEVATFLRCDRGTVYKLVERGELPVVRLGRSFRVTREVLGRFIAGEDTSHRA